jgi:hypothetical protein
MKDFETLWDDFFRISISVAETETKENNGWNREQLIGAPKGNPHEQLKVVMGKAKYVRTGYECTSVRGFHYHFIYWK